MGEKVKNGEREVKMTVFMGKKVKMGEWVVEWVSEADSQKVLFPFLLSFFI